MAPARVSPSEADRPWVALAFACVLGASAIGATAFDHGRALFLGRAPLKGKIRGHEASLPSDVVVCGNCHAARKQPKPRASGAPRVDRGLLLEQRARRGGPPSAYQEASFCRLLRTGIDPAHVLIARDMPVYDLDAEQCLGLWHFLTDAKGE